MDYYWDTYSVREKLYELGELSTKRNRLLFDVMHQLDLNNENTKKIILKLMSGEETDCIELGKLCDSLISK